MVEEIDGRPVAQGNKGEQAIEHAVGTGGKDQYPHHGHQGQGKNHGHEEKGAEEKKQPK